MSYYQLHRISNSDLTIAEHLLNGIPYTRPEVAFRLGTAFHELVLEPEKFRAESCRELDFKLLYRMYRTVVANRFCQTALHATEKEKVILWREPNTGIACKCKLDMILRQPGQLTVMDLKTTSAGSLATFMQACRQYNYDRQMAFYADSIGARQVVLIGVSKKAKRLFFVQKYSHSAFIRQGRQKYRQLLQRIQELDMFEHIYYARGNGSYPVAGHSSPKSLEEPLATYGQ
jgi:hypothetical protein